MARQLGERLRTAVAESEAVAGPSFVVADSKLHPPVARPGIVARTALVDRLVAAHAVPVISVVAPAGYGKTTLLAQWAERKRPRMAWVSCDSGDRDPAVLLSSLAVAVDRVQPVDPTVFRLLASGAGLTVVQRFVEAIASTHEPIALALDHVEAITNMKSLDTLAELALSLPPGWQLAMASRHPVPLPVGRLRVRGAIMEVGANDLAMDQTEADALLQGAGVELSAAGTQLLVGRTEGWPVGLYLAAVAVKGGTPQNEVGLVSTEADPDLGGYLRAELLDRASTEELSFLARTSVLDRMCGSLCDAILERTGSARLLEQLETRNLLVVPLDRRREWYRYHYLFRALLQSELERREPELIPELHSRAAAWFEGNGAPEAAVEHAQAAGDADHVARLVLDLSQPVWASGRVDTVLRWMQWFVRESALDRYPAIAVHGALILALLGEVGQAEQWAAVAQRSAPTGTLPDGSTMVSLLAYLRAILARDGVEAMRRDARLSLDGLSASSPYRATMLHTEGLSFLLAGDPRSAEPIFVAAFEEATQAGADPFAALILAERCIAGLERHDWSQGEALSRAAVAIVEAGDVGDYWTSALVYACAARVASHRGELARARQHLGQAARLRPLLTSALPVVSAQALLEMARAYTALGDLGGAAAVLHQLHDIVEERPGLGVLADQAEQLGSVRERSAEEAVGGSSLTLAELRLLPLLSTHLSLREIGERLEVSRPTVKTQVGSVYRKLGVSSRHEAVARTRELGLQVG